MGVVDICTTFHVHCHIESSVHIESFSYSPFAVPTIDPSLVSMIFIQGEKGKDKAKIRYGNKEKKPRFCQVIMGFLIT